MVRNEFLTHLDSNVSIKILSYHKFFFSHDNGAKTIRDTDIKLIKESGTKDFRKICYTNSRAYGWMLKYSGF